MRVKLFPQESMSRQMWLRFPGWGGGASLDSAPHPPPCPSHKRKLQDSLNPKPKTLKSNDNSKLGGSHSIPVCTTGCRQLCKLTQRTERTDFMSFYKYAIPNVLPYIRNQHLIHLLCVFVCAGLGWLVLSRVHGFCIRLVRVRACFHNGLYSCHIVRMLLL